MIKIITAIYILCSVYTCNPDVSSSSFSQNLNADIQSKSLKLSLELNQPSSIVIPKAVKIDYMEELKKLGCYKEESKDKNLNKRNAVIRFQSSCNFPITGTWDDKCQASLERILRENTLAYTDVVASAPSEGKWLAINKTKKILTFYNNKSVIKKYPVAVGNPSSLTPSGKFKIVSRVKNPTWGGGGYAKPVKGGSPKNPLGYRWMGLSYENGDSVGIHGNSSPYSIGKFISHGCIRMINSDVEELFNQISLKTEVWIGTEKELKDWGITQEEYTVEY